ncbi:MAG: helix-turn-helix transcriptional regulator [Leptolyngbya sp. SIOISBB]|nr:helix-turn-helix transcriptional regulator [Leptolyngbya sp. SIOISBB]
MSTLVNSGKSEHVASARLIDLTAADWRSLRDQAQQRGEQLYQPITGGVHTRLPQSLGNGGERVVNLRGGLSIMIRQGQLKHPIRYVSEHKSSFPLVAKFYLSGRSQIQTLDSPQVKSHYEEIKDCHYLYYLPNLTESEEWTADEPLHVVYVCVDPSYFRPFEFSQTALSASLQRLLQGDTTQRFHQPLGRITPAIYQVLQQITHCPYDGMMQQLYLESKALELLALQFAVWTESRSRSKEVTLRSADIEQIYEARDILQRQTAPPPSLSELARQVGWNDRKLKQGFRQLFGTTVFGYLQSYRLEQARLLLRDANRTVAQVALKVGYTNPEAFSTAFRRKFAVSPKAYQLGQRR